MTVIGGDHTRKLKRLGRTAVQQGLPPPTNEPPWVGAGLLMLEKLVDRSRTDGASEAAAISLDLLEATMAKRTSRQPIACARGCSYCCTSVVSATAPEIFRLARWLRQNGPSRSPRLAPDAIIAAAAGRTSQSLDELLRQRPACVLLLDGACGAYPARPGNCRRLLSASAAACKADFEGVPTTIPVIDEAMQKGAHVRSLLLAAVAAANLPINGYELTQGLAVALADPAAEEHWLNGRDVFAGLSLTQPPGPSLTTITHWRKHLVPLLAKPLS